MNTTIIAHVSWEEQNICGILVLKTQQFGGWPSAFCDELLSPIINGQSVPVLASSFTKRCSYTHNELKYLRCYRSVSQVIFFSDSGISPGPRHSITVSGLIVQECEKVWCPQPRSTTIALNSVQVEHLGNLGISVSSFNNLWLRLSLWS